MKTIQKQIMWGILTMINIQLGMEELSDKVFTIFCMLMFTYYSLIKDAE